MARRGMLVSIVVGCLAAPAVHPGEGGQVAPRCTDDSRECMIAAAKSYLDSIVNHDASDVPFAPNVKRTEQGRVTGEGAADIRESQKLQPDMDGHVNTRYFVDESTNNVVAFTLLRVTGRQEDPDRPTFRGPGERDPFTVHLAERFKVENGLITEIEAIFYSEQGTMDGTSSWPDAQEE